MKPRYTRQAFIPKNATEIKDEKSSAVVYIYEMRNSPCAIAFGGRRTKPDWHYRFGTEEKRQERIDQHFENERSKVNRKRKTANRILEVGDVLSCSWGYDQTNVDFYQVVELVGAKSVKIRKIAQTSEPAGMTAEKTYPCVDNFVGEEMTKRDNNGTVKLSSFEFANKIEPVSTENGKPVFQGRHQTAWGFGH